MFLQRRFLCFAVLLLVACQTKEYKGQKSMKAEGPDAKRYTVKKGRVVEKPEVRKVTLRKTKNAGKVIEDCTDFFPQTVGLERHLKIRYLTNTGEKASLTMVEKYLGKETVAGKDSVIVSFQVFQENQLKSQGKTYVRKSKVGVYHRKDQYSKEQFVTPFPLQEGAGWTLRENKGVTVYTVKGIEPVEVGGHLFKEAIAVTCIFKSNTNPGENFRQIVYYARNVGRVKEVISYYNSPQETVQRTELTKYKQAS